MRLPFAVVLVLLAPLSAAADSPEVSAEAIRAAVEAAFHDAVPRDARIEIVSVPALAHKGGSPIVDVALPESIRRPGPCEIAVVCRIGDRVVSQGRADAVIRVTLPVWIAGRDLPRNTTLDLSTLRRERREFDRPAPRLFRPEPGARFRVMRDVPEGTTLHVRDVSRIPDVETGSEITLLDETGRAAVSTNGAP